MKRLSGIVAKIKQKLKTIIKAVKSKTKRIFKGSSEKVYLSFGENCLTDDILKRHNLKSFSSPFAAGRSNIEYILQIVKDNYKDFLNPQYLEYGYVGNLKVVRQKRYRELTNIYNDSCMKGFEFTHHDVISDEKSIQAMGRRICRMQSLDHCTLYIFYHHRFCEATDTDLLIQHLNDLKNSYKKKCKKVYLIAFTQKLVSSKQERKLEKKCIGGIYFYYFYTLNIWEGDNQDIFWARCDDDLISQMIQDVNALHIKHYINLFPAKRVK